MLLEKDGVTYRLKNEITIAAFLQSGWQEVKEAEESGTGKENRVNRRKPRKDKNTAGA